MSDSNDSIKDTLHAMGFEFSYHLVRDEFDGRTGSSVWQVTVGRNGRPGREVSMEYTMGCGHRHYSTGYGRPGKPIVSNMSRLTIDQLERNKRSKPNNPTITDVMYSLLSDATAATGCANYAEFASEFGYDEDSISGDKIYRACQDQAAGLNGIADYAEQNDLQELFQDY